MQGRNGAISVIALAERGALFDPGPCMYMEKLAGIPLAISLLPNLAAGLIVCILPPILPQQSMPDIMQEVLHEVRQGSHILCCGTPFWAPGSGTHHCTPSLSVSILLLRAL